MDFRPILVMKLRHLQLCPDYVGIELGIGESLLIKAIGESTGRSLATVKSDLKKEGDLGLVAMVCNGLYMLANRPLKSENRTRRIARKRFSSQSP